MIINIDTNEESAQNLKRIASFLESLANQQEPSQEVSYTSPQQESEPQEVASSEAFDMFDMSSDRPSEVQKPKPNDDSDDGFRMIPY